MEAITGVNIDRLRKLADSLNCMTEDDLQLLADVTPSTSEAWRKRGQGPAFIRIGNRVFYPHKAVAEFMASRLRARPTSAGAFL